MVRLKKKNCTRVSIFLILISLTICASHCIVLEKNRRGEESVGAARGMVNKIMELIMDFYMRVYIYICMYTNSFLMYICNIDPSSRRLNLDFQLLLSRRRNTR